MKEPRPATQKRNFQHVNVACNEKGSMIVIVLMLLTIMSIIGIASTNVTVTENFIVRNTSIRKENLHLVDAVAAEVYQLVNDVEYADPADPLAFMRADQIDPDLPGHFDWVHADADWDNDGHRQDWYDRDFQGRILEDIDETPATTSAGEPPDSILNGDIAVINNRGEWDGDPDTCPVRYALVGWVFVSEGESIVVNQPTPIIKKADILVEYVSADYGVIRLIVGIKKEFSG